MKRRIIITMIMAIWMVAVSSDYAYSATGLTAAENRILEKLRTSVTLDGDTYSIPVYYLNQIENELIKNKENISDKQADVIIKKMDEAIKILCKMSAKDLSDFNDTEKVLRLLTLIDEAASEADYQVSINLSKMSVNVINPEGKMIFIAQNTINQTGSDETDIFRRFVISVSLLLLCFVPASVIQFNDWIRKYRQSRCSVNNVGAGRSHEK